MPYTPRTIIVKHRHGLHGAVHSRLHTSVYTRTYRTSYLQAQRMFEYLWEEHNRMFSCFYRPDQRPQGMHTEDTEITHSHGKLELITSINDVTSRQLNRPNRNKTTFNVHSDPKDNTFAQEIKCELVHWTDRQSCVKKLLCKNYFAKYLHSHFDVDEEQNQRAFCPNVKKSVISCLARPEPVILCDKWETKKLHGESMSVQ